MEQQQLALLLELLTELVIEQRRIAGALEKLAGVGKARRAPC